ncbi:ATP-binding protein [Nocardia sp. NPDC056100]|uniref:ATP-binding protein n=1 Tax=Nocardia sp. NPDC056100 TaxID=3345712 RepID=UPI0035E0D1E4
MTGPPPTHRGVGNDGQPHRSGSSIENHAAESLWIQTAPGDATIVAVPAEPARLSMLRALSETLCLTAGFGIGVANDIRLAVDEAASAMVPHRTPSTNITCEFAYDKQSIVVRVISISRDATAFSGAELGWRLLRAVTDTLETTRKAFDPRVSGYPAEVKFTRNR